MDDSLFISQEKSYEKSNKNLFCSYSIIFSLFEQFSLVIEHNKSEVFHFSRATKNFNSSPLDLEPLGEPVLWLKDKWRYLSFIFDKKLSFYQHIYFYSNKALYTIKDMKILGNFTRGLLPPHKWLLYRTYIMFITLYDFQLWYYKKTSLYYSLKKLKKMQHRVALWITRAFHTSLSWRVEAIAGLIPIHLYLDKVSGRHYLRVVFLPK